MSEEHFTQEKATRGDAYADGGARDQSLFEDFLVWTAASRSSRTEASEGCSSRLPGLHIRGP